jgi:transposase InsO family protein
VGRLYITDILTWAGFLCLVTVLDAFSRSFMSRAMETYLRTELVLKALDMALGHLRPAGADSCDQISQCTSAPLA